MAEFDAAAATKAVQFFEEGLVHVKGPMAGKPFLLEPWQRELVEKIFGTKNADGSRQYRTVYCEVPRKNGKTTLAAGILLYMLLCDGEAGAEVFSAASTREQAAIVYQIATEMVRRNPALKKICKLRPSKKRIIFEDRVFSACSSDAGAPHGTSPHCVVFDEVHLQKNRDLYESFQTGLGARTQPLVFAITTAGHDRSTLCWEMHQYAKGVRDGGIDDKTFLPVLFGSDPQDDWTDPETWAKANPCLDVSLHRGYIEQQCKQAEENPAFENTFRRLHLNQWTEQESRIISMQHWDQCKRTYTAESLQGRRCYGGLDLASTRDVTAFVLVFPEEDGGCKVLPWFWIPEHNISERAGSDQRMIRNFASKGAVELTDGNEVDVLFLAERIFEICQQYEVVHIGFDPWNAAGVTQLLKERGLPGHVLLKMAQTYSTYNEPFKRALSWLGNARLNHDGNPVLRWMASNVAHKTDTSGNIRPDKGRSAEKIDGICAMLMGIGLASHYGTDTSAYNTTGGGVVLI